MKRKINLGNEFGEFSVNILVDLAMVFIDYKVLYPTYDVDQSVASVHICGIVLWLGKYDIALW